MKGVEKYQRIYPKLLLLLKEDKDSQEVKDMRKGIASLFEKMSSDEKIAALNWWASTYNVKVEWSPK